MRKFGSEFLRVELGCCGGRWIQHCQPRRKPIAADHERLLGSLNGTTNTRHTCILTAALTKITNGCLKYLMILHNIPNELKTIISRRIRRCKRAQRVDRVHIPQ